MSCENNLPMYDTVDLIRVSFINPIMKSKVCVHYIVEDSNQLTWSENDL